MKSEKYKGFEINFQRVDDETVRYYIIFPSYKWGYGYNKEDAFNRVKWYIDNGWVEK